MARPRSVSDDELVAAVAEAEPAGTAEVADRVGITRQGVDKRLRELAGSRVERKKIGQALVWSSLDSGDSADAEPDVDSPSQERAVDAGPTTAVDFADAVDEAVSHMAGGDELPDTRTPALREAVSQLRRSGEVTLDELVAQAYDAADGGYGTHDAYRQSINRALDSLADTRPEINRHEDRYVWQGGDT